MSFLPPSDDATSVWCHQITFSFHCQRKFMKKRTRDRDS